MNRSFSNLIRALALAPVAAAIVLMAGSAVPARAMAAPRPGAVAVPVQTLDQGRRAETDWPKSATETLLSALTGHEALGTATRSFGLDPARAACLSAPGLGSRLCGGPLLRPDAQQAQRPNGRLAAPTAPPAADPAGAVQPGQPVFGALGSPRVSPPANARRTPDPADETSTASGETLPAILPSGLSGLLGGLPGTTGTLPPSYEPGSALSED
ncbi:response regulator receiver protein [Thermomonospora curvata DSM 43183]|uniref:Response regulator receiver protein n=1 Tax=Thermomonospora curvata (strain ATCC 19995 / DSM 43183 / JCM 3096 / KCTC 9072 / NBRC 15933 / NCIMB 10081 / Henssen B9) TaxID=471852 RepID=D1A783_THECD|nr:response regulator receiver protein [Thermomonospora curvata DSM 43183]